MTLDNNPELFDTGNDARLGYPDLDAGRIKVLEDELADMFRQSFHETEIALYQAFPNLNNYLAVVYGIFDGIGFAGSAMRHGYLNIKQDGLRQHALPVGYA